MKLDDWKDIQFVKSAWFILHSEFQSSTLPDREGHSVKSAWFILHSEFQASTLHIEKEILTVKKERHTHPQIKILVLQNQKIYFRTSSQKQKHTHTHTHTHTHGHKRTQSSLTEGTPDHFMTTHYSQQNLKRR